MSTESVELNPEHLKVRMMQLEQNSSILRHKLNEMQNNCEVQKKELSILKNKSNEKKTEILLAEFHITCIKDVMENKMFELNSKKDNLKLLHVGVHEKREEFLKTSKQYLNNLQGSDSKMIEEYFIKKTAIEEERREKSKEILKLEGKVKAMRYYMSCCKKRMDQIKLHLDDNICPRDAIFDKSIQK